MATSFETTPRGYLPPQQALGNFCLEMAWGSRDSLARAIDAMLPLDEVNSLIDGIAWGIQMGVLKGALLSFDALRETHWHGSDQVMLDEVDKATEDMSQRVGALIEKAGIFS